MSTSLRHTRKPTLFRPRRAAAVAAVLMALAAQLAQARAPCPQSLEQAPGTAALACMEQDDALALARSGAVPMHLSGNPAGWGMAALLLLMALAGKGLREPHVAQEERESG